MTSWTNFLIKMFNFKNDTSGQLEDIICSCATGSLAYNEKEYIFNDNCSRKCPLASLCIDRYKIQRKNIIKEKGQRRVDLSTDLESFLGLK